MVDWAWVTIENRSGATYRNAKLKLVADDVNRSKCEPGYTDKLLMFAEGVAKPAPEQFKEESFFEYHVYNLQRPATVKDNQTKQISLVNADDIKVKKELVFYGAQYYYRSSYGESISKQKVGVYVEIANKKEDNLGIPLPKGTVRVYKKDSEGSLQFVGEDSIDHTPKDEKVRVKLGDAFDVVGTRKQIDWKKIAYTPLATLEEFDARFKGRTASGNEYWLQCTLTGQARLSGVTIRNDIQTASPTFLNHCPMVASVTLSPSAGTRRSSCSAPHTAIGFSGQSGWHNPLGLTWCYPHTAISLLGLDDMSACCTQAY